MSNTPLNGSLTRWAVGLVLLFVAGTTGYFLKETTQEVWANKAKVLSIQSDMQHLMLQQAGLKSQQDRMETKLDRLLIREAR